MVLKSLDAFVELALQKGKKVIAVAAAGDLPVLESVAEAKKQNFCSSILVGDEEKIRAIASQIGFDLSEIEVIHEPSPEKACKVAVQLVREGKAQLLMKGQVSTAGFLRAVLDKEVGLRTGSLLSHVGFFESRVYPKLIAVTDAAQNINPTLDMKVSIIKNTIELYHRLGVERPKIALIAAIEDVNSKMPATVDAAALTMMNLRNQITGCAIDGPLGLDNAISKEAAEHKGVTSEVAGDVDLLFFPNIEVANAVYKSITYFGETVVAGTLLGAQVPIVLTSRSDSERSKLMSIALAVAACE
ncbi:MAG: bifunctional enoyl-CoA hydratase/phosphate acetyltransferase [Planctomycetia bacterium]|jgi:phosphate butyryltransferase